MLKGLLFHWMILVFVCDVFFLSKNLVVLKCPITTAGTLVLEHFEARINAHKNMNLTVLKYKFQQNYLWHIVD